jgi:1-acyl-sn-glycerol-3-phosphate acyltransferase
MGAIRVVKNGGAVLIFPEGSRSPDGTLQPAQPGIGMIAAKTGAPVVPVKILGSFKALPRDKPIPRIVSIEVRIGERLGFSETELGNRNTYEDCSKRFLTAISEL